MSRIRIPGRKLTACAIVSAATGLLIAVGCADRSPADRATSARQTADRTATSTLEFNDSVADAPTSFPTETQQRETVQPAGTESTKRHVAEARILLGRSAEHLWRLQADDGGWHSEQYGLLRSGQAYTPLVLYTLLSVPEGVYPRPAYAVTRALQFIRDHMSRSGVVGLDDPEAPEYPNYSTAYALQCLVRVGYEGDQLLIDRMRRYLVSEQFCEATGFDPESPVYGGWGFGGRRPPGSSGHMDIAHTRRVLAALRAAGERDEEVFRRAELFLRYVQKDPNDKRPQPNTANEPVIADLGTTFLNSVAYAPLSAGAAMTMLLVGNSTSTFDGGFYFSPVVLSANKGRVTTETAGVPRHFRSYATATCDGLLALWAAGVPLGDDRMVAARRWLAQHPRWDEPEGVPKNQAEPWADAIYFYHLAVRAEAYGTLGWPTNARPELVRLLSAQQRTDGSFANAKSHLMKEDDPMLATTLAVTALVRAAR